MSEISAQRSGDDAGLRAVLHEQEQRVRFLLQKTLEAQERERERICLDIHDGLTQTLTVAFQQLQMVVARADLPDDVRASINRVGSCVRKGLQEAREVVACLRPAALDDVGLVSTIQYELDDLRESHGLTVHYELTPLHFQKEVETALYRIVHEAITNVVKHANASRIAAALRRIGDTVEWKVIDDGAGFDAATLTSDRHQRHFGVLSMTKRAELLDGTLTVESAPGRGTTTTVRIPAALVIAPGRRQQSENSEPQEG
jgi:two-component system sensor histidine kinase DegS